MNSTGEKEPMVMNKALNVLMLEDSPGEAELLVLQLEQDGFDVEWQRVETEAEFCAGLDTHPDLILADYSLPSFTGIRALELRNQRGLDIPFILVSGTVGEDLAVTAMRKGATDYLLKDRTVRLGEAVRRALEDWNLRRENQRALEQLHEAETKFRMLVEQLPAITYTAALDEAKTRLYVSPQVETILGYSPAQSLADAAFWRRMVHPDDYERVSMEAAHFYETGEPFASEYRLQAADGRLVWVHDRAMIARDARGEPLHIQGIQMDITQRKLAEAETQRKNMELSLMNNVNQAVNRGDDLAAIIAIVSEGLKGFFNGLGATVYLVDSRNHRLVNQNMPLPPDLVAKVENLLGFALPRVELDLQKNHPFRQVFETKRIQLINEPAGVREHYTAFAEAVSLPAVMRGAARKAMPLIQHLVGAQAEMLVPLLSKDEMIGVMDLTNRVPFTEQDLRTMESFAGQLTAAIRRKQDEAELVRSEQSLRLALDAAHAGAWEWNLKTNQAAWSVENFRVLGLEPGSCEPSTQLALERVYPEDRQAGLEALARAVQLRSELDIEYRVVWPDGTIHWINNRGKFELDEAGEPVRMSGIQIDISERKRADAKIRLQSSALEAAANAILITDREGRIQWANPAWEELTGYSLEEAIGKNPRLVKSGVQDQAFYRNLWDTILAGKVWRSELVNRRKDGSLFYEEETITPLTAADGNVTHFIAIKQNITERKQTEQELKLFRSLLDQSNDAIEVIDPQSGRFLDVNARGCAELGYSREEFLSLSIFDIDSTLQPSIFPISDVARKTIPLVLEGIHRRKDGSTFPVETSLKYVKLERGFLIGVTRDITERQQAERKMQSQLAELQRWYSATLDREDRVLQIKQEVNELLVKAGQPPRYPSTEI